jgi:hypothetical protein
MYVGNDLPTQTELTLKKMKIYDHLFRRRGEKKSKDQLHSEQGCQMVYFLTKKSHFG